MTNQVWDDYRVPHLEEGALINQKDVWMMPTYSSNKFTDELVWLSFWKQNKTAVYFMLDK
jgi:hypothetical protein